MVKKINKNNRNKTKNNIPWNKIYKINIKRKQERTFQLKNKEDIKIK